MRRLRLLGLGLIPIALSAMAFVALAFAEPTAQLEQPPSQCITGAEKSADPVELVPGDQATVTTVFTHTCPAFKEPVSLMFVVDRSNSMTHGFGGQDPGPAPPGPIPGTPPPMPTRPGDPPPPPPPPPGIDPSPFGLGDEPLQPRPTEPKEEPSALPPCPMPPCGGRTTPDPRETPPEAAEPAGDEDLIREVQQWLREFLDEPTVRADMESGRLRIGMVSFATEARTDVRLTDDRQEVVGRLNRLRGEGLSNVDQGLRKALQEFDRDRYRNRQFQDDSQRTKLAIVLSDGKFDPRVARSTRTFGRNLGEILTVSFGRNANTNLLRDLATDDQYAYGNALRAVKEIIEDYEDDLRNDVPTRMVELTLTDQLADNMEPVSGTVTSSFTPTLQTLEDRTITWQFAEPPERITVTYDVRPMETGTHPVSEMAEAKWIDSLQHEGQAPIPNVSLNIGVPPPTATSTPEPTNTPAPTDTPEPTSTALPTKAPKPQYMPIAFNNWPEACKPEFQTVDVAIVIDTSSSMSQPTQAGGVLKLDAAIQAGRLLAENLKLRGDGTGDQAAVIAFNRVAETVQVLTDSESQVLSALDALRAIQDRGTRIDLALEEALGTLDEGHIAANKRALILLTDGQQEETADGGRDRAIEAANALKRAGVSMWTVGLGAEVDSDFLIQIADSPEQFKEAPDANDLSEIYRDLARLIPCP